MERSRAVACAGFAGVNARAVEQISMNTEMRYDDSAMVHASEATRAVLVDIYQQQTGSLVGVALVAPSQRYASWLAAEDSGFHTPVLSEDQWKEIENWIATADQRLPARPMAMPVAVLPAFAAGHMAATVVAERCASVPLDMRSRAALAENAQRMLANVMRARLQAL